MEILPSPPESESQDSDNRYCDLSSPEAMGFSNYRKDEPQLVITEQPVEKFRFRYKSEMAGTHGCLNGKNSDKSVKVTYPTVELRNYSKPAIVRCSLYTAPTKDGHEQFPHPHRLMREDDPDPHDIEVGPDLGFEAVFSNMGIIHTARKFINDELTKKKTRMYREKRRLGPKQELKTHDKVAIKNEIEEETKRINLNTVTLCFEAFERRLDGSLYSICDKVFSDPINNSKSAMTGELKICRMDKAVSPCSGGEEIFMFVEKVVKKNIEVRFFEINNETEEITWTGKGIFNDLDVHHQYAIALRTPPYRDQNINKQVLVYVELFRPSDGDRSEPRAFRYKPNEKSGVGKKRRFNDEIIPTTIESGDLSGNLLDGKDCVQAIEEMSQGVNSSEFQKFLDIFEKDLPEYSGSLTSSSTELTPDGHHRRYTDNLMSKKIPKIYKLRGGYEEVKESNEVYNQLIDSLKDAVIESNPKLKKNTQSILRCKLNSTGDKYIDEEKEIKEIEKNAYKKVIIRLKDAMKANHPNLKNLALTVFKLRLDPTGDNVLSMAIKMNLENDVYYLIQLLEEVDDGFLVNFANNVGETALHRAVELGKENIVRSLMKINANPNCPDAKGDTVFHTALKSQQNAKKIYDIVKMLCNYNSLDFDLENDDGLTAVHLAVRSNNLAVTSLLIEKGADVNHISSHDGDSALHMAVTNNNIDIVKYLLEFSKININQQNFGGYTALHKAVAEENADICKILRVYNADPNIPNNDMCVEIKQENDEDEEDEEEDPEGGITSVQLALHNKYLLDILKQEPQMYFHEDDDIKMEIKEEEIEMVETKPDVLYTEDLAVICDGSDLWEKLAEFFGCQDFVDVFRNTSSPTRAIINYKKVDVTLDVVRQFQVFLADPVEGSKLDEIIGRLTI
ncbi:nuclear factor NF-kappa-B p100 subunit isoform X2 [Chrysoperla carnea]|nr:nuclear factor NF-kappa-B p100 subunit isoform X2 [Chrysoperla carnea]